MKCIIPGANVKVFGRAIHSLSKIGEELYIEALEYGLALRTVNSSRSAYACFVFAPSFFLYYSDEVSDGESNHSSDEEVLKYKINMKSCLTVFKSLSTLEKTVDKCKIKLDIKEARLVFQLYCKHGIVKTHHLAFIECETLQAVFSKELCPNIITAQTKLLCDAVLNFQTNQDEVSLALNPLKVGLKNYIGDEKDAQKTIHTEVSLEPDEFESYQVGVDTSITFCLKELRAILAFSEPANLPIAIHFETPGKPMVLTMDTDPSFEANFVLATLADKDRTMCSSQQVSQTTNATQRITDTTRRISEPRQRVLEARRPCPMSTAVQKKNNNSTATITVNGNNLRPGSSDDKGRGESSRPDVSIIRPEQPTTMEHETCLRLPTNGGGDSTLGMPEVPRNLSVQTGADNDEDDMQCSPVIPVQYTKPQKNNAKPFTSFVPEDSESEKEEDPIPGTPPRKKKRSLFGGWSQSTTASTQSQRYTVLAPDTDDEC